MPINDLIRNSTEQIAVKAGLEIAVLQYREDAKNGKGRVAEAFEQQAKTLEAILWRLGGSDRAGVCEV